MTAEDTFVSLHSYLSQATKKQSHLFLDSIIEKYTCKSLNIEPPVVTLDDVYPEDEWRRTTFDYLTKYAEENEMVPLTPRKLKHLKKLKRCKEKKHKSIEKLIKDSESSRTSLSLLSSDLDTDAEEDSLSMAELLVVHNHSPERTRSESKESQKRMQTGNCHYNLRNGSQLINSPNSSCGSKKHLSSKNSTTFYENVHCKTNDAHAQSLHDEKTSCRTQSWSNEISSPRKKPVAGKLSENSKKSSKKTKSSGSGVCDSGMKNKYSPKVAKVHCRKFCSSRKVRNSDISFTENNITPTSEFLSTRKEKLSLSLPDVISMSPFSKIPPINSKSNSSRRKSFPFTNSHLRYKPQVCKDRDDNFKAFVKSRLDKLRQHSLKREIPESHKAKSPRFNAHLTHDSSNVSNVGRKVAADDWSVIEAQSESQSKGVRKHHSFSGPKKVYGRNMRKSIEKKGCFDNFSRAMNSFQRKHVADSDSDEAYWSGASDLSFFESAPLSFNEMLLHTSKNSTGTFGEYSVKNSNYVRKMRSAFKECMHSMKDPYYRAGKVRPVKITKPGKSNSGNSKVSMHFVVFEDCTHGFFDSLEECQAALDSANLNFKDAYHFNFISANDESNEEFLAQKELNTARPLMKNSSQLSVIYEENDSTPESNEELSCSRNNVPFLESVHVDPVPVDRCMPIGSCNTVRPPDGNSITCSHIAKVSSITEKECSDSRSISRESSCSFGGNFCRVLRWEDLVANAKPESYVETELLSKNKMKSVLEVTARLKASLLRTGAVDSSEGSKESTCSEDMVFNPDQPEFPVRCAQPSLETCSSLQQSKQIAIEAFQNNFGPALPKSSSFNPTEDAANVNTEIDEASSPKGLQNDSNFQNKDIAGTCLPSEFLNNEIRVNSLEATIERTSKPSDHKSKVLASTVKRKNKVKCSDEIKRIETPVDSFEAPSLSSKSPTLTDKNFDDSNSSSKVEKLKSRKRRKRKSFSMVRKTKAGNGIGKQSSSSPPKNHFTRGTLEQQEAGTKASNDRSFRQTPPTDEKVAQRKRLSDSKAISLEKVDRPSPSTHGAKIPSTEMNYIPELGKDVISSPLLNVDDPIFPTHGPETDPQAEPKSLETSSFSRQLSHESKSSGRRSSFSFQDSDDSCDEEFEKWLARPASSESQSGTKDLLPIRNLCLKLPSEMHTSINSKKLIDSLLVDGDW